MADKLLMAWRDYDGDRQQISIDITEAADGVATFNGLQTELLKWLAGALAGGGFLEILQSDTGSASTNPVAQSRSQAIVEGRDTVTGRTYKLRLPFPDMGKADDGSTNPAFVPSGGVTIFNPDHTDYPLLVAALEAAWVSPGENFMQVQRIYIEE